MAFGEKDKIENLETNTTELQQNKKYLEKQAIVEEDPILKKENILAQIRYLEQSIQQEREELISQLKKREEENLSLIHI